MNELILDGKKYVSSKDAAKKTGYTPDYIGQLCREGYVEAKKVGRSWYVEIISIETHRFGSEKKISIEDNKKEAVAPSAEKPVSKDQEIDWVPAIYKTETNTVIPMPEFVKKALPIQETIAQMQDAWKDWFLEKKSILDSRIESPEVIDKRNNTYDTEISQETLVPFIENASLPQTEQAVRVPINKIVDKSFEREVPLQKNIVTEDAIREVLTMDMSLPKEAIYTRTYKNKESQTHVLFFSIRIFFIVLSVTLLFFTGVSSGLLRSNVKLPSILSGETSYKR
jgi:hypothetical protein